MITGGTVAMQVVRGAPTHVLGPALLDNNPMTQLEEVRQRRRYRQLSLGKTLEERLYGNG